MNQINISKDNEFIKFVKRFGYYMVAGALVVAITVMVAVLATQAKPIPDPDIDVGGGAVTFALPLSTLELLKDFSSTELMFNETLKQWESHKAVALKGNESDVFAVLDGTVKAVYNTHLEGTVVVLEHANNLQTTYRSLASHNNLEVGDVVTRGAKIGKTGTAAGAELYLGDHLTFEVHKDGVRVDPNLYLQIENK